MMKTRIIIFKFLFIYVITLTCITAFFAGNLNCRAQNSNKTSNSEEMPAEDWSISLEKKQDGQEFKFIQDNGTNSNASMDDLKHFYFLGIGLVALGSMGIVYSIYSFRKDKKIAKNQKLSV